MTAPEREWSRFRQTAGDGSFGLLPKYIACIVIGACSSATLGQDPWPEFQRTTSRLGRTATIGPQTPRIEWSIQFDFSNSSGDIGASPVMDSEGRIFLGGREGLACVDSVNRVLVWEFPVSDSIDSAASVYQGRVLFGSANDTFYCVDASSGAELWSAPALPHPNRGQAAAGNPGDGIVYYPSELDVLYARSTKDGSEIWTVPSADGIVTPPALDGQGRLFVGGTAGDSVRAHSTDDGSTLWTGPVGGNLGVTPTENGLVYAARFNSPGTSWCLDAATGEELWSYSPNGFNSGDIALAPDGTVYLTAGGDNTDLIALSADGEELWRYALGEQAKSAPIVAGDGTVYVCSFYSPNSGHVHAVSPDGAGLWIAELPHKVQPSPMLAPDGTLYVVCRDRRLYAFQDPEKGDVSLNDIIDGRDIRFFIRVLFGVDDNEFRVFAADMNGDGVVDVNDVPLFVDTLLTTDI